MFRQGQACVFHSMAKLNYPQKYVFLPGKLCTTRQERKGRSDAGTETNHEQREGEREKGEEVDGL